MKPTLLTLCFGLIFGSILTAVVVLHAQVRPGDAAAVRLQRQEQLRQATYFVTVPTPDGRTVECIVMGNLRDDQLAYNGDIVGNGISCNWPAR